MFDNTLIIVTSDNGMPFPRAKANCYDAGSQIPLVMRWGDHFKNGTRYKELVSLIDLAPTILDVAHVKVPESMAGKSLFPLLIKGETDERFNAVFIERERHANIRKNNLGYPIRAVRTKDFLYIHNLRPERWPAGDPDVYTSVGPFGDIDNGLSKKFLIDNRYNSKYRKQVDWSLEKRPEEELYDLRKDPDQLQNVAQDTSYTSIKNQLKAKLAGWRKQTQDPLLNAREDIFDSYPYYGGRRKNKR